MNRSGFLKRLGIGVAAIVIAPKMITEAKPDISNKVMVLKVQKENGEWIILAECNISNEPFELNKNSDVWIENSKAWQTYCCLRNR